MSSLPYLTNSPKESCGIAAVSGGTNTADFADVSDVFLFVELTLLQETEATIDATPIKNIRLILAFTRLEEIMLNRFAFLLLATITIRSVYGQNSPLENLRINYRIVYFQPTNLPKNTETDLLIAIGRYYSTDSFLQHVTLDSIVRGEGNFVLMPKWGTDYTWTIKPHRQNKKANASLSLHHFTVLATPFADTTKYRLRLLNNSKQTSGAYVFLDGTGVLYDLKGEPIWFLPDVDGMSPVKNNLRDLKLTNRGTVTFLLEEKGAYEVDYNGRVLWKAPNDGSVSHQNQEYYHHELTRLDNGNYLTLGCEYEFWKHPNRLSPDSNYFDFNEKDFQPASEKSTSVADRREYVTIPFGTVIEYTPTGKVAWSWNSANYFKTPTSNYHITKYYKTEVVPHENSVYFDELYQTLYVGFRNMSRILKVSYPEGQVTGSFNDLPRGNENYLFCRQHSVRLSRRGYLYLYNNNMCPGSGGLPELLKLKEDPNQPGGLSLLWKYTCTTEGAEEPTGKGFTFPVGGNMLEMRDGSIFANMSSRYSKVFILDSTDHIRWSAIPEHYNESNKKWEMIYDYRASIIEDTEDLNRFVRSSMIQ